jgi:hypothetical protein
VNDLASQRPAASAEADAHRDKERPRGRRLLGWLSAAFLSLLLMTGIVAGLIAARLSRGPLEVEWLRERVASAIELQLGGNLDVAVGKATVERSGQGVEFHLKDIRVRTAAGRELIHAPDSTVVLDAARLATGNVVPRRLAFRGTEVRIEIDREGRISLSASSGEGPAAPGTVASAAGLLETLSGFSRGDGLASGLAEIAVVDSRLLVDDRRTDSHSVHEGFELQFTSRNGKASLLATTRRNGRPVTLALDAGRVAAGGSSLDFRVSNVGHDELMALSGQRESAVTLQGAISLSGTLAFLEDQRLDRVRLEIFGRSGSILAPMLDKRPYAFDALSLVARWSSADAAIGLEASLDDGDTRLRLGGQLARDPAGWLFTGDGRDLVLKAGAEQSRPTRIDEVGVMLRVPESLDRFQLERLVLRGPETDLAVAGGARLEPGGVSMQASLKARNMPVATLLHYWPPFVADVARRFFAENMKLGQVVSYDGEADLSREALAAALRQEPLPAEAVRFRASVTGAKLLLGHGLPPLSEAAIEAKGDAVSSDGLMSRGELRLQGGRALQLSEGSFKLTALDTWRPQGRFQFRAQAPFEAAVEFAELPEIRPAAQLPFDAGDVKGLFDARLVLTMPLVEKLRLQDVAVEMNAGISNGTIGEMFGKDSLEQANLTVRVDQGGLSARGEGRWIGTPVQIEVRGRAGQPPEAVLQLVLDDQARERRGIRLGRELTGPVPVRIVADASPGDGLSAKVDIDLSRAAIDGILPGFSKPAGRPARLKLEVQQQKVGYVLSDIQFDAGPTQLRGGLELAGDGDIVSARFQQFRLSPGDNARLEFDRVTPQSGKVTLRGNNFDARPFLKKINQSGPPGPADKEIDLNIRSTLLSGFGGEILTNAEIRLKRRGGSVREVQIAGKLGASAVNIRSEGREDGPVRVILEAADAGALFRFADIYGRMQGGRLVGDLFPGPRGFSASINIRDFVLRNEPAIRRLVAETPQTAGEQVASSAAFTKLRAEIVRAGAATTLKEAVIFGPQIGLTLQGTTDAVRDRISMSGTFVPAYGLNNAFAQVPLVGAILGGGRNEGLLGVTFSLTGRASQPTVQVNPLSAITPGIFRRIFEFPNDARGGAVLRAEPRDTTRSNAN